MAASLYSIPYLTCEKSAQRTQGGRWRRTDSSREKDERTNLSSGEVQPALQGEEGQKTTNSLNKVHKTWRTFSPEMKRKRGHGDEGSTLSGTKF